MLLLLSWRVTRIYIHRIRIYIYIYLLRVYPVKSSFATVSASRANLTSYLFVYAFVGCFSKKFLGNFFPSFLSFPRTSPPLPRFAPLRRDESKITRFTPRFATSNSNSSAPLRALPPTSSAQQLSPAVNESSGRSNERVVDFSQLSRPCPPPFEIIYNNSHIDLFESATIDDGGRFRSLEHGVER